MLMLQLGLKVLHANSSRSKRHLQIKHLKGSVQLTQPQLLDQAKAGQQGFFGHTEIWWSYIHRQLPGYELNTIFFVKLMKSC